MAALTQFKLSTKEFKFADAILRGLENIDAAKEAGYSDKSEKSLSVQAYRLLEKNGIKEYIRIETELKELTRRKSIEVDDLWVTQQFKEIYNRCMQGTRVMRYDKEIGQLVQEIDENGEGVWTFDSNGAVRALENIGKHIGYFEADNKQRQPVINVAIINNGPIQEEEDIDYEDQIPGAIGSGEHSDSSISQMLPASNIRKDNPA